LNEGTTLLSSTNNWTGSNTFSAIAPSSSVTPTTANHLANKAYVDSLLTSNNNWTGINSFNGIEINDTNISVPWKVCFGRITATPAVGAGVTNSNNFQGFGATFGGTPQVFLSIAKNATNYTGDMSKWTAQLNAIPGTTAFYWNVTNNSSAGAANSYQINWFAIGPY
jgi:hypothetical protein